MKSYDRVFYTQLDYMMQQYREGNIKTVPELMKFVEMAYGDYMEFHPGELPEIRYERPNEQSKPIRKEDSRE